MAIQQNRYAEVPEGSRVTERAVRFIEGSGFDSVPDAAIAVGRRCLLDGLALFVAGSDHETTAILRGLAGMRRDHRVDDRLDERLGAPLGGEVPVNSTTTGDQQAPSVAALPGGGYVVAWTSANQDGSGNGIAYFTDGLVVTAIAVGTWDVIAVLDGCF